MNLIRIRTRRTSVLVASAAASVLALSGIAYADDVQMVDGTANSMSVAEGGSDTFTVQLLPENNANQDPVSGCNASLADPVTITFAADDTWATVNPTSTQVTNCTTAHTITVSVSGSGATAVAGDHTKITGTASGGRTAVVSVKQGNTTTDLVVQPEYRSDFINVEVPMLVPVSAPDGDGDGVPDNTDNCPRDPNPNQENADHADGDLLGDACDSNSYAPAVGVRAGAANGYEGDSPTYGKPSTSGSFTDQDGNTTLTLTVTAGATDPEDFVDNGNGTFSWSHLTTDDASGSVTVTASDGEHTSATQTFTWTASNVDPVISGVDVTPTGPCAVSVSAPFTDQGSGDTHGSAIAWGDTSPNLTVAMGSEVSPVTGSHTFAAAGTYTIGVTVTDDDEGSDSNTAASGFTTGNIPSAIMQPINSTGTRSGFKIGSSIPVKITVTDCGGAPVTTLTPTVGLTKLDSNAEAPVNEVVSTSTPTAGVMMRWADTQYIYNLSTKNSQFNAGQPLTGGTYRVTVSDPSFFRPVTAEFDLRK